MRVSKCLGLLAIGLLLGGPALAQVPYFYVSNGEEGQIFWVDADAEDPTAVLIFDDQTTTVDDMVIGPDGTLYACDPVNGLIFNFVPPTDPAPTFTPLTLEDAATFYDASIPPGPASPQCGWFTRDGELLVNDTATDSGAGAWIFDASGPSELYNIEDYSGEGLTQAADGDLLAVDWFNGKVWKLGVDDYLGEFFTTTPEPLIDSLDDPIGIARSSQGKIYVAIDDNGLLLFDKAGAELEFPACAMGFGKQDRPFFLDFSADDTLYVATTSKNDGKVWELTVEGCGCDDPNLPDCSSRVLFEFDKQGDYEPSAVGIAVPYIPGSEDGLGGFIAGDTTYHNDGITYEQTTSFGDHAYEFVSNSSPCIVDITAAEASPEFLSGLVYSGIPDTEDPNYPDCLNPADPDYPCFLPDGAVKPVFYFGENGRGTIYDVVPEGYTGTPGSGDPDCYAPLADFFRHAINAYAGYIENPRIARCSGLTGGPYVGCTLIDLNTYFPYNGLFPDDLRVGGSRGSTTSDFSGYFLVDVDLNDFDNGDGVFCGFESGWIEPSYVPDEAWKEPDVLFEYGVDPDDLQMFSNTETFAFKFKIAQIATDVNGDIIYDEDGDPVHDCDAGPFITGARVLMSIARVYTLSDNPEDPYIPLEPFKPTLVYSAGSSAAVDPAIFNDGNNPTKQYHFNAKFPYPPYESGIYQIVLVPLTNNFAAEVRYFQIP